MAEVQVTGSSGAAGSRKGSRRRQSTRVDLTPMVDLGFLLITFFMLTTALAKPQIMPVLMPEKDFPLSDPSLRKESQVLTLILGGADKVYCYEGISSPELDSTNYSADGLRRVILDKKYRVDSQWGRDERPTPGQSRVTQPVSKLTVLIKPTADATYKNVVDAFDEMKICGVAYYVLLDVSPQELDFIRDPAAGLHFDAAAQAASASGKN